jgi:tetratricopeptide (TPR) repeat protein
VRGLLDELLPLTADERAARLAGLRRGEPDVAAEVESLLGRSQDSETNGDTFWPPKESQTLIPAGTASPEGLPDKVGRYEVVEVIGRGGMGAVYRVRDTLFRRTLALKILAAEFRGDAGLKARFLEESQLMGQLQHPGIPPVHDMGESPDGRPYFTMKLIRGDTLAQLLEARGGVEREQPRFLGIFEQVCETLACAHMQGVIHRDLKPANIMVGAFGEVQAMDWGLAKVRSAPETNLARGSVIRTARSDAPEAATRPGSAMGTPAYMAPEQARGEVDGLDARCDVFGLGAILCEILTGEPPFVGFDVGDVLRQSSRGNVGPALARLGKSGADADLVALATRCLAEEREARPEDAGRVHGAVAAHLAGVQRRLRQAEIAKKEADVRSAERRERRRTVYRLGAVIAALLLTLAAGGAWVRHVRAEREHQKSMVRQGVESRFDELDRTLGAGKTKEARDQLERIRSQLAGLEEPDLGERLADREADRAFLDELDALFGRRWQVMQQVVLEHVHSGKRGNGLAMGQPRLDSAIFTCGVTRDEMRDEYEAAFRRRDLDPTRSSAGEVVRRVEGSVIRAELIDALDQWFLLEPKSPALFEVLNAVDDKRSLARRMLAARDAGKPLGGDPNTLAEADPDPVAAMYLTELLPDDRAVALLKRTVRRFPADYRSLSVLTYRLLLMRPARKDRAEEAAGYALAAHALKPENSFACLMVSIALKASGRLDEAIRQARRAVELDDEHAAACYHLGLAYSKNDQRDEAIAWWKRTVALDPKHHSAYCNLGWSFREKEEYDEAIRWLVRATALDPQCMSAPNNMGRAYAGKKEYAKAVEWFSKVIATAPTNLDAHNNMGDVYLAQRQYESAIEWYRKATVLDPKDATAYNNLGMAYVESNRNDEAIAWLRKAIGLSPRYADAHNNLGWAYNGMKQYDEAIPWLRKALELDPKNVHAHNNLGVSYKGKREFARAIECLREAIALDPRYTLAFVNMGDSYALQEKYPEALGWYAKALALEPDRGSTHIDIAWVYLHMERYEEATRSFRKGLALDPDHHVSPFQMGELSRRESKFDEAVEWYERAIASAPRNAAAHRGLGLSYTGKREYAPALASFRAALAIDPALADRPSEAVEAVESARRAVPKADWPTIRYNAACVYALIGDSTKLPPAERARLRKQALAWLGEERAGWATLPKTTEAARKVAAEKCRHALAEEDFKGVRDPKALEKFDAQERKQWQDFWQAVRALVAELEGT